MPTIEVASRSMPKTTCSLWLGKLLTVGMASSTSTNTYLAALFQNDQTSLIPSRSCRQPEVRRITTTLSLPTWKVGCLPMSETWIWTSLFSDLNSLLVHSWRGQVRPLFFFFPLVLHGVESSSWGSVPEFELRMASPIICSWGCGSRLLSFDDWITNETLSDRFLSHECAFVSTLWKKNENLALI